MTQACTGSGTRIGRSDTGGIILNECRSCGRLHDPITTKAAAPTTLHAAVAQLNAATAKLATMTPTAAVAEQSTPANPQPGDVYLDEEARTIRIRSKGWSGREPERVREYALPDSGATNIPAPLRDKQSK